MTSDVAEVRVSALACGCVVLLVLVASILFGMGFAIGSRLMVLLA